MAELVLELLSEEIPARMQKPMAEHLKKLVSDRLEKESVYSSKVKTFITPRRLVLFIDGLSISQESTVTERKGPRTDAPEKAVEGFMRSAGISRDQLTKRTTDNGEFYFAVKEQKSRKTGEIIKEVLEEILPSLTWPKSMRWGSHNTKWVRPLKNICCVFGSEILPIKFGHLESNNKSEGHRFLSSGQFEVADFKSYRDELKKRKVLLNANDRIERIIMQTELLASQNNLTMLSDEALMEEVAGLVEWPEVLLGNIDKDYMNVPEEVLISSIRTHQKYFCLRDKNGKLAPNFLVVSNMETSDEGKSIIAGNERVLRARLSDANFFWNQDKKIALKDKISNLDKITFHARLGTIGEKTTRIQATAKFLAVWIPHAHLDLVEYAAKLCKADLTTEMVGEFPELQGIMGYYYAKENDEKKEVAEAIKDHYSPAGPNDDCPKTPVSIAIAIADKIDSLVGLFAIDEKPTGSKDPFALRRAALGVIRIILENRLSVPLKILFEHALKQYPKTLFKQTKENGEKKKKLLPKKTLKVNPNEVVADLLAFFEDRLKYLLKSENARHDLIAAVFSGGREDDLLRVVQRVAALTNFLATEEGKNLLAAYKRATNIVRIEEKKDNVIYKGIPSKTLLDQKEEKDLNIILSKVKTPIKNALKESQFEDAMKILAQLNNPINAFFDNVTVNSDKPDLRKNRLKLLSQMREILHEIADFSLIEG